MILLQLHPETMASNKKKFHPILLKTGITKKSKFFGLKIYNGTENVNDDVVKNTKYI